MIGSTVDGRYQVIRLLGQGGMGAVFEVRHVDTSRRLALKVIRAADATKVKALVLRLQREARAAGSIDSPHIGQVIDAGTDPITDTPYLVMELLDGEDLQQVLDRVGPLRPDVALRLLAQACLGLEKAHEARVIHRDVKPANLFVARQRSGEVVVKVLDFGIAKLKQEDLGQMESGSLTRTGSVLGSPLYMSPEQARGAKAIDHRADLWSLGVVGYQLLSNRTPYQEIDALGELIVAICSELPPCLQDFAPWVATDVAAIIHKALSLDAGDRYQSAGEMIRAIAAHLPKGPDGAPDLKIREDMLVGADEALRSTTAPRLVSQTGRRPATTARPAFQRIVTPAESASAAAIESGPTLMLAPRSAGGPMPSTGTSGDVRVGTTAGVSRSSPAQPPRASRGPLFAGIAGSAVVVGIGVALLTRGAGAVDEPARSPGASAPDGASSGASSVARSPSGAPSVAAPVLAPAPPGPTSTLALPPPSAAPSTAPVATATATATATPRPAPPPTSSSLQGPASPRPPAVPPAAPAAASPTGPAAGPPLPSPTVPPGGASPPLAGTSGFGDRK